MHGQYARDMRRVDWGKTWQWLRKGDHKVCIGALMCSAQEQALRINCIKFQTDKKLKSPNWRKCGEKGESIRNLTSEYSKQAQREYDRRHDNVAPYVHLQLRGKVHLERANNILQSEWQKVRLSNYCGIS